MPATIFSGSSVKALKKIFDLNGGAQVISSTTDPTGIAVSAPIGTILLNETNSKVYRKLDAGSSTNWVELGASGAAGINYIKNPDAEANTVGWATYADAAAALPVDGTGGSPNVTWTRSTTSPLRGIGEFVFTKDSVNRQGQGASYDFVIDSADQAKVLTVSFDYEITSGTFSGGSPTTNSDLIVYIYDKTNALLIEPSYIKMDGGVGGQKYNFNATFQTSAASTSYRVIIHCSTTSAVAYTVAFDNFIVGPQIKTIGSVVTDPIAYTPTSNWANCTVTGRWWRSGKYMFIDAKVLFTGVPGGGAIISIPAGYSIDTSVLTTDFVGKASGSDVGTGEHDGIVVRSSTTEVFIFGDDGGGQWSPTNPFTMVSGDSINYLFKVPIVGWDATATVGQDADTRQVYVFGTCGNSQSIPDNTQTVATLVADNDSHGSLASNEVTLPISGPYEIFASNTFSNNAVGSRQLTAQFSTDGSIWNDFAINLVPGAASNQLAANITRGRYFNSGTKIRFRLLQDSGGSLSIVSDTSKNHFSIIRMPGPASIAAPDVVAARYTVSAAVSTSTTQPIDYSVKDYDTTNSVTTGSSWKFTAPIAGKYEVKICGSNTNATPVSMYIYKNGTASQVIAAHDNVTEKPGGGVINLIAGDFIDIRANGSRTTGSDTQANWVTIEKIG